MTVGAPRDDQRRTLPRMSLVARCREGAPAPIIAITSPPGEAMAETAGGKGTPAAGRGPRLALVVGSLALGWTVIYLDRSLMFPLLPVMAREFQLTDAQRGAIVSAYFITYVAMQIPSGVLGDRLGLKRVLVAMYLMVGVGLLGLGLLSRGYALLLTFMALHGFGAGAFYSGSYGITIATVPGSRRGLSSAVVTAGMASGLALGLAFAGALYRITGSWRGAYVAMVLPTMLVAVVLAVALRRVPTPPLSRGGFRYLLTHRDVAFLSVANFCSLYGSWVLVSWGPSLLVERRGMSVSEAGMVVSLVAVLSLVGALIWGRLSDRTGRRRLSLVLFLVATALVFWVVHIRGTFPTALVFALYGLFGVLAWNPILVAWLGDHTLGKVGTGTTMAVVNTAGMSSAFVAPVVSGWISDLTGSLNWAFYLGAAVYAAGTLSLLLVREATRPVRPSLVERAVTA